MILCKMKLFKNWTVLGKRCVPTRPQKENQSNFCLYSHVLKPQGVDNGRQNGYRPKKTVFGQVFFILDIPREGVDIVL